MTIRFSVLLPLYNESGNIPPLLQELDDVLAGQEGNVEILCVDDGSTDNTRAVLEAPNAYRAKVVALHHRKNFGQSAAFTTGLRAARGEILITLDGDGQNVPADIPKLLDELAGGCDAVCGSRTHRQDSRIRHISSRIARRFRNLMVGDAFVDSGCNFRVLRREVVPFIPAFNGVHRFVPFILQSQGFEVREIPVGHRPRVYGVSKYGIHNRMWRGIADCIAMRWWGKRALPARRLQAES